MTGGRARFPHAVVPLLLFVPLAAWFHALLAGGGYVVGNTYAGLRDIDTMVSGIRSRVVAAERVTTLDVELEDLPSTPEPPEKEKISSNALQKLNKKEEEALKQDKLRERISEKKEPYKTDPARDEKKEQLLHQTKIAVKQYSVSNQKDNPNARYAAENANHVDEETAASQTALDQNDLHPTPGGQYVSKNKEMGDSEKTKIADSEDRAGKKDRPAGEQGRNANLDEIPKSEKKAPTDNVHRERSSERVKVEKSPLNRLPEAARSPSTSEPLQEEHGGWSFSPLRKENTRSQSTSSDGASYRDVGSTSWLGLGARAEPGKVNLNLSHTGVVAAVGEETLAQERVADGERRKSQHRGSWQASTLEKWRSSIENYVASVKPGNQTALNAARVPFAAYLHAMHLRIHPIFADSFLNSLEGLPESHPLSNRTLYCRIEFALDPSTGSIKKIGVVRASGVTAFDIAALDAVSRAAPYGPAPDVIVSPDGRVYLQWEFHRDDSACTTAYARPFILNIQKSVPAPEPTYPPKGPVPSTTDEREMLNRGAPKP